MGGEREAVLIVKEIQLTQGKVALVDCEDFRRLSMFEWHFTGNGYAGRRLPVNEGGNIVSMHREVIGEVPEGMVVDHINRNKLDNRRSNLRITTQSNNAANSGPRRNSTSKYKGVHWRKKDMKWVAKIERKGRALTIGLFNAEEHAALAYNQKAKELFGKYAYLNELNISEIDWSKEHRCSSDYVGVTYDKANNKWRCYVPAGTDLRYDLGRIIDEEDAARLVDFWSYDIFGTKAKLNRKVEVVCFG
ncbi:HNH endonuclease [Sporosarcina sp. ITBMC105]